MINIIKKCLSDEAQALLLLADRVEDEYFQVAKIFAQCKGKIIFTGVGKSLIISEKIAASFTSLGITSISLNPLSMLHGDIGFFSQDDILVCLSKSGETDILLDVVNYIRSLNIQVVSLIGNSESSLYKFSDYSIIIETDEAGPFGLVPTTSTTAMMAVGDALLCAVVRLRGITMEELKKNHPGGAIGRSFSR